MTDNQKPIQNLNILCAETGHKLAFMKGMEEKILNEALSVLEEQGPYAMFLYVKARHKKVAPCFEKKCCQLLKQAFEERNLQDDSLDMIKTLAENLDDLLFGRDLLRTTLAYARFLLKAREG